MSDSVQMTLIADTPTAGDVAGLGMSSERDLAAAAWAVARRGALAELSEPEAALVGQLGPILDCSGPGSAGGVAGRGGDRPAGRVAGPGQPHRRRV